MSDIETYKFLSEYEKRLLTCYVFFHGCKIIISALKGIKKDE